MIENNHKSFRHYYYEYRSEAVFGIVLMAIVALSYLLSPLIPFDLFRSIIAPVQNTALITVTLVNTWAMFRHSEGLRIRRIFAWIMAALTVLFVVGIGYRFKVNAELRPAEGIFSFEGWELMAGDLIAWLLLAYPAELLRPGWLTFKNALTRVLPVFVIGIIDWFVPWDLRWLLALVPLVWIALLFHHLRAYRIYSEENFGSVEQTDEKWVIRYLVMIFVLGCSYAYLCFSEEPTRLFTQQWLIFFIIVYTNDQVIFRAKPWIENAEEEEEEVTEIEPNAEYREKFIRQMDNDINTPNGVTALYDVLKAKTNDATKLAAIGAFDKVLSLSLLEKAAKKREELKREAVAAGEFTIVSESGESDPDIEAQIRARQDAKKAKNFAEADRIRDALKAAGIELTDIPHGAKWKRV